MSGIVARLARAAALSVVLFLSSALSASADGARCHAAATLPPLAGLVEELGAGRWDCAVLVAEGQDPHLYEPTLRQLASIGAAAFLVHSGMTFETILAGKIRRIHPETAILQLGDAAEHSREHDDPHAWLDPAWLGVAATQVSAELTRRDPEGTEAYAQSLTAYQKRLAETVAHVKLRTYPGRAFVAYHPAYSGFAKATGLTQLAIERDGKEPGPRNLLQLRARAQELDARVIVLQTEAEVPKADAFVRAAGGLRTVFVHPLGRDSLTTLRTLSDSLSEPPVSNP